MVVELDTSASAELQARANCSVVGTKVSSFALAWTGKNSAGGMTLSATKYANAIVL